ncbi:MAG: DUF1080 domain-containing protein, partial [Planctomycetaceae bacterium]
MCLARLAPLVLVLLCCGSIARPLAAVEPAAAGEAGADESGFSPLFDGESLAGWHGATGSYVIEDNTIVCRPTKGGGNLYTDAEFADFELRFDFRLTPAANNGIGLRVPDGGHASTQGLEIQVLDDTAAKYEKLQSYQYHGSVYGIVPAERGHLAEVGEWNSQVIRYVGDRITIVLNGQTIVDADLGDVTAAGTADGKDHPGLQRTRGHLCFCGHGSVVAYRNLRIREIPTAES